MRHAQTQFVGGPLDGTVLPVALTMFEQIPKRYKVPVPATADQPAYEVVYEREEFTGADKRRRWRYVHVSS